MYLTRSQIADFVTRVGQPRASVLLNRFFQSYCQTLGSADVAELYDEEYGRRVSGHPAFLMVNGRYKVNLFNRFSFEYLQRHAVPGQRLVDYGCGDGSFAMAVTASLRLDVLGVDVDAATVAQARTRASEDGLACRFCHGSLDALQAISDLEFVTLNDVVEHLSDGELAALFNLLRARLKDEGELVIHTPNGLALCNDTDRSLLQRLYRSYLRFSQGWQGFERTVDQLYYDQVHINIKSFRGLSELLGRCGFESRVIYDEPPGNRLLNFLSSNMLVVAKKKREVSR